MTLKGESNLWTLGKTKNKVLLASSQTCNSKYDRAVICGPPNSINQEGAIPPPCSAILLPPSYRKKPTTNNTALEGTNHTHYPDVNTPREDILAQKTGVIFWPLLFCLYLPSPRWKGKLQAVGSACIPVGMSKAGSAAVVSTFL